jgi:hypothetical protein
LSKLNKLRDPYFAWNIDLYFMLKRDKFVGYFK